METRWGKRFGRYEILGELGRGAMGVVYKARDPKIDRFVAVKAISLANQNPDEEREYRERFFLEAQAAGRLLHPGIVTIFDTGEDPESHIAYIVMEYIAGHSLEQLLSESPKKVSLDTALLLTEELAEALDHAHGQGVVHRDMKPANVLLTPDGHAKIADFGIAKLNQTQMTLPGRALGTPAYMAPEQLEGEPVDNRSDLFSLGAILYRMITGYGPFQGNSVTTVCFKVANREPLRPTALDPDLPPALDAVMARAMAKDPAQRYQRGLQFALDVRELRQKCQETSSRESSALRSSGVGGVVARSDGKGAVDTPVNLVLAGSLEAAGYAAEKTFSMLSRMVTSCWRRPAARAGLVFSVVVIGVTLFAHHESVPKPNPNHLETSAPVGASALPPPVAAGQSVVDQRVAKGSHPKIPQAVPDSVLDVRIEHRFSAADLSLWIDDKLAYDRPLRGQTQKHWNPFRTDARENETIPLAAGKHRIRVRVRSAPDKYVQSAAVVGTFTKAQPTILQINFERQGNAMHLALR